jgi:hypothetical protein
MPHGMLQVELYLFIPSKFSIDANYLTKYYGLGVSSPAAYPGGTQFKPQPDTS